MSLFTNEQKRRINVNYPALTNRGQGMGAGGLLGLIERQFASTAAGFGAAAVGISTAITQLVSTDVNGAIDELSKPVTLTVGVEAADVIAVDIAGPAHSAQYLATVVDANGAAVASSAFHLAETGAGAEVSNTAQPSLFFTTSVDGYAEISVTDVVGASGATCYLSITPASVPAGAKAGPAATLSITFD